MSSTHYRSMSTNPAISTASLTGTTHKQFNDQSASFNPMIIQPQPSRPQVQQSPIFSPNFAPTSSQYNQNQSTEEAAEFDRLMKERTELLSIIQKINSEKDRIFKLNEMLVGKLRLIGIGRKFLT